jgi:HAD superfamily hydrolase (TIGR01549 family)
MHSINQLSTDTRKPYNASSIPAALLWDIDGTLIDTTDLVVNGLNHVYRMFLNKTMPHEDIRKLVGIPLSKQLSIFGDPASKGISIKEMEAEFIRFWEQRKDQEIILTDVIYVLKKGYMNGIKTALVTSKNRQEIKNTLPRMQIDDYLDLIICADDVKNPKPDPEGVMLALKKLEVRAEETIFIGDSVYDMRAARSAGVRSCAVTWGAATPEMLRDENPDILCNHAEDLVSLLGIPHPKPDDSISGKVSA